ERVGRLPILRILRIRDGRGGWPAEQETRIAVADRAAHQRDALRRRVAGLLVAEAISTVSVQQVAVDERVVVPVAADLVSVAAADISQPNDCGRLHRVILVRVSRTDAEAHSAEVALRETGDAREAGRQRAAKTEHAHLVEVHHTWDS